MPNAMFINSTTQKKMRQKKKNIFLLKIMYVAFVYVFDGVNFGCHRMANEGNYVGSHSIAYETACIATAIIVNTQTHVCRMPKRNTFTSERHLNSWLFPHFWPAVSGATQPLETRIHIILLIRHSGEPCTFYTLVNTLDGDASPRFLSFWLYISHTHT